MGFFTTVKPKVTKDEYKKIKNELAGQGFTSKELAYVDELVEPHIEDKSVYDTSAAGVDAVEVKEIEEELNEADPKHIYNIKMPQHKKDILVKEFDKYLKK
jgi:hypothetical protein